MKLATDDQYQANLCILSSIFHVKVQLELLLLQKEVFVGGDIFKLFFLKRTCSWKVENGRKRYTSCSNLAYTIHSVLWSQWHVIFLYGETPKLLRIVSLCNFLRSPFYSGCNLLAIKSCFFTKTSTVWYPILYSSPACGGGIGWRWLQMLREDCRLC